jgi:hypothetical protein
MSARLSCSWQLYTEFDANQRRAARTFLNERRRSVPAAMATEQAPSNRPKRQAGMGWPVGLNNGPLSERDLALADQFARAYVRYTRKHHIGKAIIAMQAGQHRYAPGSLAHEMALRAEQAIWASLDPRTRARYGYLRDTDDGGAA